MRAGLWCALLVAVAVAAGCGSSDSDSETSAGQTTDAASAKQEFLARGDAICAQAQAEAGELARRAQEVQAQSDTLEEAEILDRAEAIWDDQITFMEEFHGRVADLDAPPGDEVRVQEFLESITDGIEVARKIESKLAAGESPSGELVQEYANIVTRGNTLARAYGFTVCGATGG